MNEIAFTFVKENKTKTTLL